jgi:hypothetical protein
MRILIITTFFPPDNSIAADRPYTWAKYWSRAGHDVTVLTLENNSKQSPSTLFPMDGFKVVSVTLPRWIKWMKNQYKATAGQRLRARRGILASAFQFLNTLRHRYGIFCSLRMPDVTDLWIRPAIKKAKSIGTWDLVVSSSGPYAVHIVAYKLERQGLARRWVADYRDLWVDARFFPGLFPFTLIESWLERKLLRHASCVTTVSGAYADHFRSRYSNMAVHVVENGFDPELFNNLSFTNPYPEDGKVRIAYFGTMYGSKTDPSPLFEAVNLLNEDAATGQLLDRLEILFFGQRLDYAEQLIKRYSVGRWVFVKEPVTRDMALQMQRTAHALLFLPWTDARLPGVVSGKIFEYLYSGTQILAVGAAEMGASQQLILDANGGWVFGRDAAAIKEYLRDLLLSGRRVPANTNFGFLKQFHREALAHKFLNLTCSLPKED